MLSRWVMTPSRAAWSRQAVVGALLLLLAVALLIAARRAAGTPDRQLPLAPLAATALGASGLVTAARRLWDRCDQAGLALPPHPLGWRRAVGWCGSAALVLLAVGCCYPGQRNLEWLIWLPLLIGDQLWRQSFFDGGIAGDAPAAVADGANLRHDILQNLFRVREADGREAIYGSVRADFQTGQRHATLHVGFCPPLGQAPEIEAEACEFPDAQVKVAEALAHGVRLDVRLVKPVAQPCVVLIDLAARPRVNGAPDSRCDASAAAV